MFRKIQPILIGGIFLLLVTLTCIFTLNSNHRQVSQLDGRLLASYSAPKISSVLNKTWMANFEQFSEDRIPFREHLLEFHGYISKHILQQDVVSGIWTDKDSGRLFDEPQILTSEPKYLKDVAKLADVVEQKNVPLILAYIPRRQEVFQNEIAPVWQNSYLENKSKVIATLEESGRAIDLTPAVSKSEMWYLTDHHWNDEGANSAAESLVNFLSSLSLPINVNSIEFDEKYKFGSFIGSLGRRITAGGLTEADDFSIKWSSEVGLRSCSEIGLPTDKCTEPVLHSEIGNSRNKYANKYSTFLGGDLPFYDLRGTGNGTYIILKDSFGDSMVPYFALHAKRVVAIDERHYEEGNVSELIRKVHPDAVIFLHNQLTLNLFSEKELAVWK